MPSWRCAWACAWFAMAAGCRAGGGAAAARNQAGAAQGTALHGHLLVSSSQDQCRGAATGGAGQRRDSNLSVGGCCRRLRRQRRRGAGKVQGADATAHCGPAVPLMLLQAAQPKGASQGARAAAIRAPAAQRPCPALTSRLPVHRGAGRRAAEGPRDSSAPAVERRPCLT